MESSELNEVDTSPSYIATAARFGVIFGLVSAASSLLLGYYIINSDEPVNVFFSSFSSIASCLITVFCGYITVRSYMKEFSISHLALGQGAVIGVVSGLILVLASTFLSQVWNLIDPSYIERFADAMVASLEAQFGDAMSPEQLEAMMDNTYKGFEDQKSLGGILKTVAIGSIFAAILNAISGLIGAKIHSKSLDEL